ncbi:MAG: putative Ig domain-containing protein [Bacteroidales bacterium]|nr:putative Ig domain-containing protein [Bacteroidales bacterium]
MRIITVVTILSLLSAGCSTEKGKRDLVPLINPPFITSNYPGTPFLFYIPTEGARPVKWSAIGLPSGLSLDVSTGIIQGSVVEKGDYPVTLTAENDYGKTSSNLIIKIGDLLALTPPMGWNSWNTFDVNISDSLIRQIADSMESSGMKDVGYQYINIDDLWQLPYRDQNGKIQINTAKFPHGIKAVADYVHSKGLKLGIYSDAANLTCGGVAGSYGYEEQDAMDFASWGIDLLKYDYCNAPPSRDTAIIRYKRMAEALRKTGRSIVFSICEWGEGGIPPHGQAGGRKPYEWASSVGGNYWRTTLDIRNSWLLDVYNAGSNSIMQILDMNAPLADYAGPGHWNDPDMLVVGIDTSKTTVVNRAGVKGCTMEEYRSHMSLWCLMAAPLLAGNDIRNMNLDVREILINSELIAINQDPLGKQAKRIRDDGDAEVFAKPLSDGSWAVGLLNRNDSENKNIGIEWQELGISGEMHVRDLWKHETLGRFSDNFVGHVEPHQCVVVRIFKK